MKPTEYYNYSKNISVVTTPNGDKVITMNEQIFTELCNHLHDAATLQEKEGRNATAEYTKKLWGALIDKEKEGM